MIHDLIVNFYCKSADKEPKYRAPVGIFTKEEKVLSKEGFKRAGEGYYRDYEKEISETELPKWTEDEYVSEVMDILYSGEEYDKIILEALALEPTLSENIIKSQITDNHTLSTIQSKSKSF